MSHDGYRVYQTKLNTSMMRSLTVMFPPNKVLRSLLKANLCCWVIPLCRSEYCCSRAEDEFRDNIVAREASKEASGTRPASLESHSILCWTYIVTQLPWNQLLCCSVRNVSNIFFFQAALNLEDTEKKRQIAASLHTWQCRTDSLWSLEKHCSLFPSSWINKQSVFKLLSVAGYKV